MSVFEERLQLLVPAPASDGLRARLARPHSRRRAWTRVVPMAAAAAGLIAAVFFALLKGPSGTPAGRHEAEKEFRAMEETLRKASALRVTYTRQAELKFKGTLENVQGSGILLLKEGDRLHLTMTETRGGAAPITSHFYCDGKEGGNLLKTPQGMKSLQTLAVRPTDLHAKVALSLARQSVAVPSTFLTLSLDDLRSHLEVSAFAYETDPKHGRFIAYKVGSLEAKVWIDPSKGVPVRRVLHHKDMGTITETYDWDLAPELADDLFRAPK